MEDVVTKDKSQCSCASSGKVCQCAGKCQCSKQSDLKFEVMPSKIYEQRDTGDETDYNSH